MNDSDELDVLWTTVEGEPMRARSTRGAWAADAPTAVLVPGLGLSGDYLLPLACRLAPSFRAVVVDLPGSGGCPGPARPLRADHLGEVLALWLDARKLSRVVLVGNSFGSEVALETAIRRPERVLAVVAGAPTPDARRRSFAVHLVRLARAAVRAPRWLVVLALRDYARTGFLRLLREGRAALDEPVRERLSQLSPPLLVVRGEHDPVVPQTWAEEVARLAAGRLEVVPGAGHASVASRPDEVARLVAAYVEDVPASTLGA